ncbi:phosphatidylinositol-specific phospholipase c [Mycoplasmopsis canis UFG4]|uniref:1-phosphatidylinositol phosphodiesterase n=2 Tax=Mycoplasmopsis canis TaxID=29555 RepID=I1A6J6_9BACT|nr:phosphatidylinositol-specific phospholipase c [Mycoplasmopsis canis UFG4]
MKKRMLWKVLSGSITVGIASFSYISEENKEVWKNKQLAYGYYPRNYDQYNFSSWMEGVNDNKSFFDLSIPGTHDSGMWSSGFEIANTQSLNIENQLKMGIRGFDIRLNSNLDIVHGITFSKINFDNWLNSIQNFLNSNPSEFVVARVKDENFDVNNPYLAASAAQKYNSLLNKYRNILFNPNGQILDNDKWKLKNLRGKLVILNLWHHKVSQSKVGGDLYWNVVDRYNTQQDAYEERDENIKQKWIRTNMINANGSPLNNYLLYVNFLSVSGRPLGYNPGGWAEIHNNSTWDFLSQNENLYKLGLVYMDYPGPSLVQSIFKRNYKITDKELELGYLGEITESVQVSELTNDSREINFYGLLNNFNIEIIKGDKVLKSFHIDKDHVGKYSITLDEDIEINIPYKFRFYKKLDSNIFYEGKKFNEFTISKTATDSSFWNKVASLKSEVNNYINLFNKKPFPIKRYLNGYFLYPLESFRSSNSQNKETLARLQNEFNSIKNLLDNLNLKFEELEENNKIIPNLESNFRAILDSNNINNLKQINSQLIYTSEVIFDLNIKPNTIRIHDLINFIQGRINLISNIKTSFEIWDRSNITNSSNLLIEKFVNFNYGKEHWLSKTREMNILINDQLKEVFNNNFNKEAFQEKINSQKDKIETLINNIDQIKTNILGAFEEKYVLLFQEKINNLVINNQNPISLINEMQLFQRSSEEANDIISNDDEFRSSNNFSRSSELKDLYVEKINILNEQINNIQQTDEIIRLINEIKLLKQSIKNNFTLLENVKSEIQKMTKIFDGQKEVFLNELKAANITNEQINNILNQASILNEINYIQKFNNLSNLNEIQRNNFIQQINNEVSTKLIEQNYLEAINFDSIVLSLKNKISLLDNFINSIATRILTQNEISNVITEYENSKNLLNSNESKSSFVRAIEVLSSYEGFLNTELYSDIWNLWITVNNSQILYDFEKTFLLNKIKNLRSRYEYETYVVEINEKLSRYTKRSERETSYQGLNPERKTAIVIALNNSLSDKDFEDKTAIFRDLSNTYNIANNVFKDYINYKQNQFYKFSNPIIREKIDNAYKALIQSLESESLDKNEINQFKDDFLSIVESAKKLSKVNIVEDKLSFLKQRYQLNYNSTDDLFLKVFQKRFNEKATKSVNQYYKEFIDINEKEILKSKSITLIENEILKINKINSSLNEVINDASLIKVEENKKILDSKSLKIKIKNYKKLASQITKEDLFFENIDENLIEIKNTIPNDEKGILTIEFINKDDPDNSFLRVFEGFELVNKNNEESNLDPNSKTNGTPTDPKNSAQPKNKDKNNNKERSWNKNWLWFTTLSIPLVVFITWIFKKIIKK